MNKITELKDRICEHQKWIDANSFDSDGVKERQEWIDECLKEIETLEETL